MTERLYGLKKIATQYFDAAMNNTH